MGKNGREQGVLNGKRKLCGTTFSSRLGRYSWRRRAWRGSPLFWFTGSCPRSRHTSQSSSGSYHPWFIPSCFGSYHSRALDRTKKTHKINTMVPPRKGSSTLPDRGWVTFRVHSFHVASRGSMNNVERVRFICFYGPVLRREAHMGDLPNSIE